MLAAPVILGEDVWGILGICIRQEYQFSPEEVRFAGAVAQQAAIAIGNAKLYADLRSAYEQLEAAQEQAVQTAKLGALGQMAGGVAHDFNNLLAAILGRAELLQRRTSDPTVIQGLKVIQGAALDGAETVRRILGFARAKGEEQAEPVEIASLLQQVVEIARPRWKDEAQARARLHQRGPRPGAGAAGPGQRGGAARGVPERAPERGGRDAGRRDGHPRREVARRRGDGAEACGETVECFVRDTGVGMSAEVRRRAFDPFFTTKGARGTGLGLSVVYGIVSRHGGRVRIDSRENIGTTVTLNLPVFCGRPSAPVPEPGPVGYRQPRILVVDDEEVLAQMLADILRLQGEHIVEVDDRCARRAGPRGRPTLRSPVHRPRDAGAVGMGAGGPGPGAPSGTAGGAGDRLGTPARPRRRVSASGVVGVVAKPYRIEDIRKAVAEALSGALQST